MTTIIAQAPLVWDLVCNDHPVDGASGVRRSALQGLRRFSRAFGGDPAFLRKSAGFLCRRAYGGLVF